jgi:endonuclease-3 related protein
LPGRDNDAEMDEQPLGRRLLDLYRRLFGLYGGQRWWPADTPFEMMVGAVLTQSTSWRNVEKAIANLKAAGALSPEAIRSINQDEMAAIIRPSGYHNAKAKKLKSMVEFMLTECGDDLGRLFSQDTEGLRRKLLGVHGVGPETADSILLYAGGQPVFVIDAYTRRILARLGLAPKSESYEAYRRLFMSNLPADAALFNEYHALLVRHGKDFCRKSPACRGCCLNDMCDFYSDSPL